MKKIFIPTVYLISPKWDNSYLKNLPKNVAIVSTVQFSGLIKTVKRFLEEQGKNVHIAKTHQEMPGQILGCDVRIKDNIDVDAYLYIGDGKFHPTKLLYEYKKPVYTYNPADGKIERLDKKILENYVKKKKGAMLKFLSNTRTGVLFTTKPGQNKHLSLVKDLEKKYPEKTFYTFIANEINFASLEDFPFIQSWINTACPRIEEDFRCVNIDDLLS